ncbi:MAG: hypothetical protein ACI845_003149 [Gammaproteobacteria bacterium]|jgi:hypothetical protein
MHKTLLWFIVLSGISCFTCVIASSIATITTLDSPVWVKKNNTKTELSRNSLIKVGDNIMTGETGRVEMKLWSSTMLQLNASSDITILLEKNSDAATPYDRPRLYLDKGMACISYDSNTEASNQLKLNIGNTMFAIVSNEGDICITRNNDLSSIKLRAGSVQVTHSVDPNLIVLSVIGTEFRIDDKGSFKFLIPGDDAPSRLIQDQPKPKTVKTEEEPKARQIAPLKIEPVIVESGVIETNIEKEEVGDVVGEEGDALLITEDDPVSEKSDSTEEIAKVEPKQPTEENIYDVSYRVYLFSTRSEDVAKEVNLKFQKAGHNTQIYTRETGSEMHYRIAVSGFKFAKTAKDFAQSVVGTLGITGTWIGH